MRIKYIIPFALGADGVNNRAGQIPRTALKTTTEVDCVAVRNDPTDAVSYYEAAVMDMYIIEAALRAEDEGYDAVVMDTVSDSGLYPLRARLTIPVMGPGLVAAAVARMLGKKFSILAYVDEHKYLYEKNLDTYHLWGDCASIRVMNIRPDYDGLFGDDADHEFERMTSAAEAAIAQDGADVILLGSTTMHEAGDYIASRIAAPVINPGPVALKLTEALVDLGLSHSKVAFPSPKFIQDGKWFALPGADAVEDSAL